MKRRNPASDKTDSVKRPRKPVKQPQKTVEDDEYEDGDIATPKRDRDDEQHGL